MKPPLILVAGCLPLAVLTVWSFVELGSIDEQAGLSDGAGNVEVDTDLTATLASQVDREKPLIAELAGIDLLSRDTPAGLDGIDDQSDFAPLKDTWPQWTAARRLARDFLEIERSAALAVPDRIDQIPLEDLPASGGELAELKRSFEQSKGEYEALKRKHGDSPARATEPFFTLLDSRIDDLGRCVERCQERIDAAALLADARTTFQTQRYAECSALCDQLLADHAPVLDASVAAKVRLLKRRAEFWGDAQRLSAQLGEVQELVETKALLEGFLGKYNDPATQTPAERAVIRQLEERLRDVDRQLAATAADRAAEEMIEKLDHNLPPGFGDRLRGSVRIVDRYRTERVLTTLRRRGTDWLRESLPEKQLTEPPDLREAETTDHEIVRGYFARVTVPGGEQVGYKRYPSPEALADPAFDVGTYPNDAFHAPPGPSVPRRSVTLYHNARDRLLRDPGRRGLWLEMATICESIQAELGAYRAKDGAGRDDPDLSFDREARFLRDVLAGPVWADIERLFSP